MRLSALSAGSWSAVVAPRRASVAGVAATDALPAHYPRHAPPPAERLPTERVLEGELVVRTPASLGPTVRGTRTVIEITATREARMAEPAARPIAAAIHAYLEHAATPVTALGTRVDAFV